MGSSSVNHDEENQMDSKEDIVDELEVMANNPKKCPNLTVNALYQICDILVALSLVFWAYFLSPKDLDAFSAINESSLMSFISRSIITFYFAAFSFLIFLCSFYY